MNKIVPRRADSRDLGVGSAAVLSPSASAPPTPPSEPSRRTRSACQHVYSHPVFVAILVTPRVPRQSRCHESVSMRLELRCWALSLLLAAQLVFMFYYVLVTAPMTRHSTRTWSAISFVQPEAHPAQHHSSSSHSSTTPAHLANLDRRKYFGVFNTSRCFLPGTDVRFSRRFSTCECLSGWHGPDCSLPEVIWRAFITARHKRVPQLREQPRRIVCCVKSQVVTSILTEIFVQELDSVVDLFVVAQVNATRTLSLPPHLQHKTLQIKTDQGAEFPWHDIRQFIADLRHDDLVIFMSDNQIPNSKALIFFKLYDGWPQPIAFRLRWSVFGFFWQHPKRTILGGKACTAGVLAKQYNDKVSKLGSSEQSMLIIGDLNHFGGWECSWCLQSPDEIIKSLKVEKPSDWDISSRKIDVTYIEELIGNGLWVDGKTQLIRTSLSRDPYFAPTCVLNNSWKYDFLTQNMYARLDY